MESIALAVGDSYAASPGPPPGVGGSLPGSRGGGSEDLS
eukprot:CAMPEP_0182890600 /NCGR_PEP_ID=MMETSP0034_2-20130328/22763_1 /TAXON_ID=156128 /ORGANISM="Nephroselmis pyriformis, Strain CCMP717" /LENGTH=38 /DNA_ID= /DNA_START= /DNA_END= /DNA_ORIENTATION=